MPSSPRTPRRRTPSSNQSIDLTIYSPSSRRGPVSRPPSQGSVKSSILLRPTSSQSYSSDGSSADGHFQTEGSGKQHGQANGLGNLADELAEALEEDDEAVVSYIPSDPTNGNATSRAKLTSGSVGQQESADASPIRSLTRNQRPRMIPSPSLESLCQGQESQSDSGDSGPDEEASSAEGITRNLHAQMATIEHLAKQLEANTVGGTQDFMRRLAVALRNLPAQSDMENGTSRLITSHNALASHMANQTRALQTLAHPLLTPLAFPPETEVIEDLLPLLSALIISIPLQNGQCLAALHNIRSITSDLQSTLTYLSDSIYMCRQTMMSTGRSLRTVSDMVVGLRREAASREEAIRWIEKGEWQRKLLERQCQSVCGEVVGGFEEVCRDLRRRLVAAIGAS